jgi:hypothetical protein
MTLPAGTSMGEKPDPDKTKDKSGYITREDEDEDTHSALPGASSMPPLKTSLVLPAARYDPL